MLSLFETETGETFLSVTKAELERRVAQFGPGRSKALTLTVTLTAKASQGGSIWKAKIPGDPGYESVPSLGSALVAFGCAHMGGMWCFDEQMSALCRLISVIDTKLKRPEYADTGGLKLRFKVSSDRIIRLDILPTEPRRLYEPVLWDLTEQGLEVVPAVKPEELRPEDVLPSVEVIQGFSSSEAVTTLHPGE